MDWYKFIEKALGLIIRTLSLLITDVIIGPFVTFWQVAYKSSSTSLHFFENKDDGHVALSLRVCDSLSQSVVLFLLELQRSGW